MEHPENKYGDSSTEDEAGSQTTEDEVPERQAPAAPPPPPLAPAPAPSSGRERPHYELRHTMRGHTSSISAVKFSPDGTLLASCGAFRASLVLRSERLNSLYVMLQRTIKS